MNHWEAYPHIWKTKAEFFTWLRGALRKAVWERYPPKIEFKKRNLTKPPDGYTGRAKSGAICSLTGEWTTNSNTQVDHIHGNVSLREYDDIEHFIHHLLAFDSNMQLVDKEAHKIKSHAERKGMSFEEAAIDKEAIALCKDDTKAVEFLTSHGVKPTLKKYRRNQVVELLTAINNRG